MEKEWRKFGNTVLGFAREVCDAKMIASKEKKLRKGRNEEIWRVVNQKINVFIKYNQSKEKDLK